MIRDSILKRLEALERVRTPDPLIVEAMSSNGELIEISAKECCQRPDVYFVRVLDGESLNDLDLLLAEMRKAVDAGAVERSG